MASWLATTALLKQPCPEPLPFTIVLREHSNSASQSEYAPYPSALQHNNKKALPGTRSCGQRHAEHLFAFGQNEMSAAHSCYLDL